MFLLYVAPPTLINLSVGGQEILPAEGPPYQDARGTAGQPRHFVLPQKHIMVLAVAHVAY